MKAKCFNRRERNLRLYLKKQIGVYRKKELWKMTWGLKLYTIVLKGAYSWKVSDLTCFSWMQILPWRHCGTALYNVRAGRGWAEQPQSWLCMLKEQESGNCVSKVKTPDWSNALFVSKAGRKVQRSRKTEIVVSALKWLYIWGNRLVSCHSCLILLGLLLLWTMCSERTRKTISHIIFFTSVDHFIFSYLTHEVYKTGPSCSTLNHFLFHLTGTWFQKSFFFQSYSRDGYELTCIVLHSQCLLWRVSSEMKNIFEPAFRISVWISGHSPIKVCLFVIANVNTTIQGHLVIKSIPSRDV